MKKLIIALVLFTNISLSQEMLDLNLVMSLNAGIAMDNNEDSFVSNNHYASNSFYDKHVSFVELTFFSTNQKSFSDTSLFKTAGNMTFKYFYPLYSSDSITTKFSGNLFGFDVFGINFLPKTKWVDFVLSTGLNMGSKKVRVNKTSKYKNWIFAPKLTADLRFLFSEKVVLTMKAEQQYDLTKGRFKLKKGADLLTGLQGFKYNAFMVSAGIGVKF